jgi:hypothetical protein
MLTFNVGPAVPKTVKTLADFVGRCKAKPAKANFASRLQQGFASSEMGVQR